MKVKILIQILLCLVLISCSKEDSEISLSQDALAQTTWEGTMVESDYNDKNQTFSENVVVQFFTSSTGQIAASTWFTHEFTYSLDKKLLTINNNKWSAGQYTILEYSKNKLVFEKYDMKKYIFTLHYKY